LWILPFASGLFVVRQRTDVFAINRPRQSVWSPVENIGVKLILRRIDSWCGAATVTTRNSLAEEIGLYNAFGCAEVVTRPFPVDLIEIIRHHNGTSDDSCTWSSLENDFDTPKENVEFGPDVGRIHALSEGEVCAIWCAISDSGSIG
jgi:hypothetical protein